MKTFHFNKTLVLYGFLFFALIIFNVSCESSTAEDEIEEIENQEEEEDEEKIPEEEKIDSLLVGNWTQVYSPTFAFNIDSLGYVTYYRHNLLTGKLDLWANRKDKIYAKEGKFEFLETMNCMPSMDSIYNFIGDTLVIPMQSYTRYLEKYLPLENIESFTGKTRNESFVKANIENNTHAGLTIVEYESSDSYEEIYAYEYAESHTYFTTIAEPGFDCAVPLYTKHQISFQTDSLIDNPGVYDITWGNLVLAFFEDPYTYNLSYNSYQNPILDGQIIVDSVELLDGQKLVKGSFNITYESEFLGEKYQTFVKDGAFELYIELLP